MKISTLFASVIFLSAVHAGAETNQTDFLKKNSFGKFSFIGCMMEIDQPASYVYVHIGNTYLTTQSEQVNVQVNTERFGQRLSNKTEFVEEYIYRQNYCSFIR